MPYGAQASGTHTESMDKSPVLVGQNAGVIRPALVPVRSLVILRYAQSVTQQQFYKTVEGKS